MTAELVPLDATPATLDVPHWAGVLEFAIRLAEYVNNTEMVPAALRGRPDAVAAVILYGAEVGLTPMQALGGIHIVEGRPAPSSETMRGLILRAGHSLAVHEASGTRVRVSGLRRGRPEAERLTIEWTLDMARAAGLLGRQNWRNYPRAMLMARATGDLARILFPDAVKGLGYVAEDGLTDDEVTRWGPPEVEPKAKPPSVSRRPRKAAPVAPVPTQPAPPLPGVEDVPLPPLAEDEVAEAPDTWLTDEEAEARHRTAVEAEVAEALAQPPTGPPPQRPHVRRDPYPDAEEDLPLPPENQLHPEAARPLPELQPEAARPEAPPPGAGPVRVGTRAVTAIQTLLTRELGTAAPREERLAFLSAILGREVVSSKELTRAQGMAVLAMFDRFATGEAGWEFTNDPARPIRIWESEPTPEEG